MSSRASGRRSTSRRRSPASPPREVEARCRAAGRRRTFSVEEIGRSVEGVRSITPGSEGALHVLLWSQMHGDEPTRPRPLRPAHYVRRHRADATVKHLLRRSPSTSSHAHPTGPSGSAPQRAGIDINRDALRLQTPEGGAEALPTGWHRRSVQPAPTRTGGRRPGGRQARSISLLAVAFDEARGDNRPDQGEEDVRPHPRRARRLAPGQVARYDDEFESAFATTSRNGARASCLIETAVFGLGPDPPWSAQLRCARRALQGLDVKRRQATRAVQSLPMNRDLQVYQFILNASV